MSTRAFKTLRDPKKNSIRLKNDQIVIVLKQQTNEPCEILRNYPEVMLRKRNASAVAVGLIGMAFFNSA